MPSDTVERIADNLQRVREAIACAAERAGRAPEAVTLIAVTKSVGVAEVARLYELGVRHFGENRPEYCQEKISALPADAVWHSIGNLQRRKARVTVEHFRCIDAVDRLELAETLNAAAQEAGQRPRVLIEVNVSGEVSKHGFGPENLVEAVSAVQALPHLELAGLMTMAPFGAPEPELRRIFATLHRLAKAQGLGVLSMGMTDDFEVAIEEGATEVRVGRALFE
jgi:pyridoxal phosphate enzyme (YggS family)